jgi:protein-disulfide isomerase
MAATPAGLKRFYLVLGLLAVAGVIGLAATLRGKPVSIPANVAVQVADTAGFRGYVLGSETAPVEIVEFGDYQCPACASFDIVQFPTVKERLIETGRVRWVYRDFPLDNIHPSARTVAHAAACADEQGKYWEAHRFIYESQQDWARSTNPAKAMREIVTSIGVEPGAYDACMQSAKFAGRIQASYDLATRTGVGSTPSFVIGGRIFAGALPYDELRKIVDSLAPAAPAPASPN